MPRSHEVSGLCYASGDLSISTTVAERVPVSGERWFVYPGLPSQQRTMLEYSFEFAQYLGMLASDTARPENRVLVPSASVEFFNSGLALTRNEVTRETSGVLKVRQPDLRMVPLSAIGDESLSPARREQVLRMGFDALLRFINKANESGLLMVNFDPSKVGIWYATDGMLGQPTEVRVGVDLSSFRSYSRHTIYRQNLPDMSSTKQDLWHLQLEEGLGGLLEKFVANPGENPNFWKEFDTAEEAGKTNRFWLVAHGLVDRHDLAAKVLERTMRAEQEKTERVGGRYGWRYTSESAAGLAGV